MEVPLVDMWEKTKFGESTLIEFDSLAFPSVGVYTLLWWAKKSGYPVAILDALDTLKVYSSHAKLLGLNNDLLQDTTVIKLGGRIEVGKVIGRISITEERVVERELARLYSEFENQLKEQKVIVGILGIEKLLSLYSKRTIDILSLINFLVDFVGDEWQKSFYFINVDMMESHELPLFPMLREFATTIVRLKKTGPICKYFVCKALNPELDGLTGEVDSTTAKKLASELEKLL